MDVLFLTQFFTAPNQPGMSRAWMLASYFAQKGHEVKVVATKVDYMTGKNVKEKNETSSDNISVPEGVTLKLINTFFNGKSKIKRLLQYIIYCFAAIINGFIIKKPDVVIASSPPIFVGLVGCWIAKLRGAKFVFEIRDPWPDALLYFGVLKESIFTNFLYWMEMYIYKNAHQLVALTPGIKRLIVNKGIAEHKIIVVTNGFDDHLFEKDGKLIYSKQNTVTPETKVIYIGSMGKINEPEYMMEVVSLLKDVPKIKFEFIGAGICKEKMMKTAQERNLTNVTFLPSVGKDKVPQLLCTGDIAIVFTKPGLYSEIGLHNKIFDYMGAGIPVVATGGGDLKALIEYAGGGYTLEPRDVKAVVEKILYLHENKKLARQMGENARNYIVNYYGRERLMAAYEGAISKMLFKEKIKYTG